MVADLIKSELKNLKSPLYRNSLYITLAMFTTAVTSFVFWNVASRVYSPADVGVASSLVSILNLIFGVSMLGLNTALIRFYPEYGERAIGSALVVSASFAFIVSGAYVLIVRNSENFSEVFSLEFTLAFIALSAIGTASNILGTAAIAMRKANHRFIQNVLFGLRFVLLYFLVSLGVSGIIGSFGLGLLFGLVHVGLVLKDHITLSVDREYLSSAFRFSLGNYIANISDTAPNYLMPSIVLTMLSKEEAAYFFIAFAMGNLLLIVPNSINMSFFVEGSHGLANMKRVLKKAIIFSYAYLAAVSIFVWFFGKFILAFFGPEYVRGLDLLRIVTLSGFLVVVVNFYVTILNVQKRVREVATIYILKAILFLGLSYLLVPMFGIVGVGYGWTGTYLFVLAVILVINTIRLHFL
ncbi:lipopolysaccharide biosynthesis protein [Thermococcus sp. GR6]|uniref:lipopolysaccharide biosynthesis protein n=1 Tax=Thermococcus sp. GR6 TaxID=1638256 RepID=UPI001430F449|nr:lipopolysaccharide biosynthesis protein [Thermococcus sp. GR6]NJE42907.1 lipopolysaccharide biosynthesis protein [Thermococcus sp. GR6]